jgi:hypothetical protein
MNDDELLYYLQEERSRDIFEMFNFIDLHQKLSYRPIGAKENEDWELSTVS